MKPSAIDYLVENLPSPYAFRTARSVCSRAVDTPTDKLSLFICGGLQQYPPPAAISSRLSHTRARLSVFSNFQTLLAAFFPQQVHTDKPSDFFWKNLSYRSIGICFQ